MGFGLLQLFHFLPNARGVFGVGRQLQILLVCLFGLPGIFQPLGNFAEPEPRFGVPVVPFRRRRVPQLGGAILVILVILVAHVDVFSGLQRIERVFGRGEVRILFGRHFFFGAWRRLLAVSLQFLLRSL